MSASRTAISAESAECAIKFPTDAGGAAEKMGMDPPASDTYPADAMIGGGERLKGRGRWGCGRHHCVEKREIGTDIVLNGNLNLNRCVLCRGCDHVDWLERS